MESASISGAALAEAATRSLLNTLPFPAAIIDREIRVRELNAVGMRAFWTDGAPWRELRFGDLVDCTNSLLDPAGCGRSKACKLCPICEAVERTFCGQRIMRHRVSVRRSMAIGAEPVEYQFLMSTAHLSWRGKPAVLVLLEDRN